MHLRSRGFDPVIPVCALVLSGFGVAIISSVAPNLVSSQIVFYLLGFILFFLFSRLDYRIFGSIWKQLYAVSLILLLITLFLGIESRGATRWISIAGFRLQFSEILKPFLLAALAGYLAEKKNFLVALILGIIPMALIFKQPDLGSAIVYFSGFSVMIFLSGINLVYLVAGGIAALVFLPVLWRFLAGYQKNRILSFLNPGSDPLGASYNAIQATIAVGSGQLFGLGLGRGTQSQLLFLPEHHTDFVFASLAEEMGFVGAGVLLLVYFILIWRIFKTRNLLAICLGVTILAQVFINVGMNMGLLPVTGITLPLVSYGGSSILATFISLGIIENIASSREIE